MWLWLVTFFSFYKVQSFSIWQQSTPKVTENLYDKKCMLMDIIRKKKIVAEGRWSSNNPEQTVHSVRLGLDAVRVWVDIVKVNDAAVWRFNFVI